MNPEIVIQEQAGFARTNEFVRLGVPWAQGQLRPTSPVQLLDADDRHLPCQTKALNHWPDGSIKWLLTDFPVSLPAGETGRYRLMVADKPLSPASPAVTVHQGSDTWQVDTGSGIFTIDCKIFRPFCQVTRQGQALLQSEGSSLILSLDGRSPLTPLVDAIELETAGPLRAIVAISGHCDLAKGKIVRFSCRLHFFAASLASRIEFILHNPQRAIHSGGLWDLGDPGSLFFKELALSFAPILRPADSLALTIDPQTAPLNLPAGQSWSIFQESSGGQNWQGPNHRNREGIVPLQRDGYTLRVDGTLVREGRRASPSLWCGAEQSGLAVAIANFWQEFPKAISFAAEKIHLKLFPGQFPDLHELQGGERKSHTLWVDFASQSGPLAAALAPLQAVVLPQAFHGSTILGDLPGAGDLVDRFSSATALLAKRELIDEYGWRNFGDVYADHEAVLDHGDRQLVSHYNNQYDLCAGSYRKFFATGDPAWATLAGDLARHILDIDLYHSDEDREEYNHGLFWHTDHYLDAGLGSHRSFSKEHLQCKSPALCGGGPGPEHCYTTGLLLHYFQTGDPAVRQAVINLAEWELKALNGSPTLLAALQRGRTALQLWRSSKGSRRLFPRYPLTRGTGNALTACLDAFELGGGRKFLDEAGRLIRGAIHPDDDLAARNLLDAEKAWSYTVLLAAIAKYLDKKAELGELDPDFGHARASLLAYAGWMVEHEYPYLDRPEILEYPNETWDAQDLRKSVVLYQAARYSENLSQQASFLDKARFFFTTAAENLAKQPTSALTRPVVLMLQNGWVGDRLTADLPPPVPGPLPAAKTGPTPYLGLPSVSARIIADIGQAVRQSSLAKEWEWLKIRL